ncbi:sporulation lipoprotein, YhcN/YlaJ family [Bacillus subtilis]|uniref:YhcN/YlaJ family sporulation lipoprotein n=1 Tax=Bacillus TaxID=1386 RepID=UPI000396E931|nr:MULTISPECIES: YhcN/YlaJ family sporulation lipoprotein [Bacillus]MEC2266150.1 YhcN/YlaJ family sporulation lipoprotein [Bacillus subtilis]MED3670204.1 YhcN/YlaJ family sporulation lipoprotein [Bacillus subtilis]MED4460201.1 YhcN/YlaJ family sporulation lipoprotein [Bacillus subtilis]PTN29125.1 YhcN/YlaJ family sporulation lipoprotein [Bacillus sp. Rc4]PWI61777.1 YhcN/YlaJ family sporulation lipoprotein [Bacillus subtilis]
MLGKKQVLASVLLIPLLMTGCGVADQGEGRRDNNDVRNVNYRNPANDDMRNVNNRDNVDNNVTDNVNNNNNRVNDDNNNNRKLEVADEAADKVTDLKEVKHADVIVAGNQAYVAVVLTNGNKGAVEDNLKKKIAQKVRSTDKNIDNVYVSANPDFVERMQGYGKRIQNGDPIAGLFDEFTQTVQRVFPNAE